MRNSSFLIRFIDIGLIILFGFLSISDLEVESRFEIGHVQESVETTEVPDRVILVIIGPQGQLALSTISSTAATEPRVLADIDALAGTLAEIATRVDGRGRTEWTVVIDPHADSFVQHTVDVMDVCTRLGLKKTLAR